MKEVKGHYVWDFWLGREQNIINRSVHNDLKSKSDKLRKKEAAKSENMKNEDVFTVSVGSLRKLREGIVCGAEYKRK